MRDLVRLNNSDFRNAYEKSFRVWSTVYNVASTQKVLPRSYLDIQNAFRGCPPLPRNLRLQQVKRGNMNQVYATGHCTWGSTRPDCEDGLPSFRQKVEISVIAKHPIPVSVAETPDRGMCWELWFPEGSQNYLSVLALAWAYFLSARWVEIMPGITSLAYTDIEADDSVPKHQATVDLCGVDPDETRWWLAVLAPTQGWKATMLLGQDTFLLLGQYNSSQAARFCCRQTVPPGPIQQHLQALLRPLVSSTISALATISHIGARPRLPCFTLPNHGRWPRTAATGLYSQLPRTHDRFCFLCSSATRQQTRR